MGRLSERGLRAAQEYLAAREKAMQQRQGGR